LVNGKIYIGSTNLLWNRHRQHLQKLKNNKHKNKHLQNSFNKYGKDNFKFIVVEIVNTTVIEEIRVIEQEHLDNALSNWDWYYNLAKKVTKTHGYAKNQEEANRKNSESKKRYYQSEEGQRLIKRLAEDKEGKTYEEIYGEERAAEIKKKIREDKLIAMNQEHVKENLRQMHTGKTFEDRFGAEKAKEIKLKQSIGRKGKAAGKEAPKYRIYENIKLQATDGTIYTRVEGVVDFAKEHGLCQNHLTEVLSKKRKSHRGWRLVD
jgi:group I intron endonuclease